jgi:hypothetical protein
MRSKVARLRLTSHLALRWNVLKTPTDSASTFPMSSKEAGEESSIQAWCVTFINGNILKRRDQAANEFEDLILHLTCQ